MNERGIVLLEVLVALAVLALVGMAALGLMRVAIESQQLLAGREQELRQADRLLTAYTLLTRSELDQRIGAQRIGSYLLHVERPDRVLYRIAISDTIAQQTELLVTVVYRPEQSS